MECKEETAQQGAFPVERRAAQSFQTHILEIGSAPAAFSSGNMLPFSFPFYSPKIASHSSKPSWLTALPYAQLLPHLRWSHRPKDVFPWRSILTASSRRFPRGFPTGWAIRSPPVTDRRR